MRELYALVVDSDLEVTKTPTGTTQDGLSNLCPCEADELITDKENED